MKTYLESPELEMVEETQSIFNHLWKSPRVIYVFHCLKGKDGKGKTKEKQEHSDYKRNEKFPHGYSLRLIL